MGFVGGAWWVVLTVAPVLAVCGYRRSTRRRRQAEHLQPNPVGQQPLCRLPASGVHRVLITGSNSGLGLDTARWLAAHHPDATEIILAVRSQAKGDAAVAELVKLTGRPASLFSVLVVSVGDIADARAAAGRVRGQLDGVVLNAGGMGGGTSTQAASGALTQFAINSLGHAAFVENLIQLGKLVPNAHIVFISSFAARGFPLFGLACPEYPEATVDAVVSKVTGASIDPLTPETVYGYAKSVTALYASALARRHPEFPIFTVSPGSTTGTQGAKNAPLYVRFTIQVLGPLLLVPLGVMHPKEMGTMRYVEALLGTRFRSGAFLGSPKDKVTGELQPQAPLYPLFADEALQEAAFEAVHRFID